MLDLLHWYARAHGTRAVRVIHDALTEEALRHDDEVRFESHDSDEPSETDFGACTVPAVD